MVLGRLRRRQPDHDGPDEKKDESQFEHRPSILMGFMNRTSMNRMWPSSEPLPCIDQS